MPRGTHSETERTRVDIALSGSETAPVREQRILIVDDDHALLDVVVLWLRAPGRSVVASATFEEARGHLRAGQFDVLLTDVRLGAFNGLQLAVIARDSHPATRIIVFSGFDDPVLRQEAMQLGATYLVKPVSSDDLLGLIERT